MTDDEILADLLRSRIELTRRGAEAIDRGVPKGEVLRAVGVSAAVWTVRLEDLADFDQVATRKRTDAAPKSR